MGHQDLHGVLREAIMINYDDNHDTAYNFIAACIVAVIALALVARVIGA